MILDFETMIDNEKIKLLSSITRFSQLSDSLSEEEKEKYKNRTLTYLKDFKILIDTFEKVLIQINLELSLNKIDIEDVEEVKEKLKLLYDYLNEEANSCYLYNNFLDNKDILEISKILKMVKTTYKDTKEQLENFHFQII